MSKNPGEEGLLAAGCLGAALVGVEGLDANCAPTALSKNPPPEEEGLEEPFDVPATVVIVIHTAKALFPDALLMPARSIPIQCNCLSSIFGQKVASLLSG